MEDRYFKWSEEENKYITNDVKLQELADFFAKRLGEIDAVCDFYRKNLDEGVTVECRREYSRIREKFLFYEHYVGRGGSVMTDIKFLYESENNDTSILEGHLRFKMNYYEATEEPQKARRVEYIRNKVYTTLGLESREDILKRTHPKRLEEILDAS